MTNKLILVGAGAHGLIVADAVEGDGSQSCEIAGFADDDLSRMGSTVGQRWKILGNWAAQALTAHYLVTIGSNTARRQVVHEIIATGRPMARPIISSRAYVSTAASVGLGTVILAGAVVQSGARVGEHVVVNAGAVVDHDAQIGDFAHVGLNAVVTSFSQVRAGEFLTHGGVRNR